ncbi:MAG TPA: sigma-70 family RNA polymerase sigma factor [Longimicrobiales bacterium]|nr:sigma-70 family RNA polymerase sigma factor [Longimicrobiales bacterium]
MQEPPGNHAAKPVNYAELTDQDVVAHALQGRESAYRELIGRYERPVFSVIYRMIRDREQAEDLAQETFIKVFNALNRYDPKYKFSSWIFKIAHNATVDLLRKKEPATLSLDGSPHARTEEQAEASSLTAVSHDENPEQYTSSKELGGEIEAALAELRPEYREALILWHIEGRPYDEIAEIMDLPLGTVKTYIHRGRNELRGLLEHLRS